MTNTHVEVITTLPTLTARAADSNKGDFGRVLLMAGSRGMSGAAVLCGRAALRAGAGLVYVAIPEGISAVVAAAEPCYLTLPWPQDAEGRFGDVLPHLQQAAAGKDVLALGPGLGQGPTLPQLVAGALEQIALPLLLDADGLNALAGQVEKVRGRSAPVILTPHPGEFTRLLGLRPADVQANREELALRFAKENGVLLVLKGHQTLVTDGQRLYRNMTGNPGLATGGTGDVLTGMIAALLGQGLNPFAAAQLGVHVHGLAGDLARDDLGEMSLLATDLLTYLPRAFRILSR